MSDKLTQQFCKLEFREDDGFIKCYLYQGLVTDESVLLGCIKLSLVVGDEKKITRFKQLMSDCLTELIRNVSGLSPELVKISSSDDLEGKKRH